MKKLITVCSIIVVVGSLGYLATQSPGKFDHHGVLEEIHHNEHQPMDGHLSESDHSELPNHIDTSEFVKVHSQDPKLKTFFTQFRTKDIISFPCQNCHNAPLAKMQNINLEQKKAHWDIEINHASAKVMKCTTCHQASNMDYLNSLSGQPISIDRSFELCSQCHSTQYKDWLGGAHGKSVNGWKPPRIAKTCVNCHNPHNPAFESRWPSRLVKTDKIDLK
jgi:nitrate/TMAO reductase-like tetraheme cytochrome c subunit